ncbi:MAG: DsrE family protein [Anaerolineales bacterium]
MSDKLVIICTHGPENFELATLPFMMANAAQAAEVEVLIALQGPAAWLARKGVAERIEAPSFPPFVDLLNSYVEAGGEIYVCGPCVKARKIDPETEFVDGARVVTAPLLIKEVMDAGKVLTY